MSTPPALLTGYGTLFLFTTQRPDSQNILRFIIRLSQVYRTIVLRQRLKTCQDFSQKYCKQIRTLDYFRGSRDFAGKSYLRKKEKPTVKLTIPVDARMISSRDASRTPRRCRLIFQSRDRLHRYHAFTLIACAILPRLVTSCRGVEAS